MTPYRGNPILFHSSQQLARLRLRPLTRALPPELQRNEHADWCVTLGMEVSGHHQKQLTQTLKVHLLKMHFFTPIFDCKKLT